MKILYVTTIGSTMNFFRKFIEELIKDGNIVDIATNETISAVPEFFVNLGCKVYPIETSRSPFNKGNLVAINQIKKIVTDEHYDIVHCHTPIAAMCTRLACRRVRKSGTRVFYTAHGFHFYKDAPLKNWLVYYPVEKICSYFTDVLITINKEDYALAQKKMKAKKVEYVPGVGIDLTKFGNTVIDKASKRKELGLPEDAKLLISVGELNENKNHETVIRALSMMDSIDEENIYYIIVGRGDKKDYLQELINSLGLTERIKLLGYRTDMNELYAISDIFVFSSFREGLSVSVMEAMASGLRVVCSRIRGNVDLIDEVDEDGQGGGVLFDPHSVEDCKNATIKILSLDEKMLGKYNFEKIKFFSTKSINDQMMKLLR